MAKFRSASYWGAIRFPKRTEHNNSDMRHQPFLGGEICKVHGMNGRDHSQDFLGTGKAALKELIYPIEHETSTASPS
jgi:hypothetical protein